jgi:hypothetical protein
MDDDPVEVFLSESYMQAQFLRNMLADLGILATIAGDDCGGAGMPIGPVLWTRRRDAPLARQILEEWDRARVKRRSFIPPGDATP